MMMMMMKTLSLMGLVLVSLIAGCGNTETPPPTEQAVVDGDARGTRAHDGTPVDTPIVKQTDATSPSKISTKAPKDADEDDEVEPGLDPSDCQEGADGQDGQGPGGGRGGEGGKGCGGGQGGKGGDAF